MTETSPAQSAVSAADGADFHSAMQAAAVSPLWERHDRNVDNQPRSEPPFLWPWRTVEPLIQRAIDEVTTETAERRVLSFANPGLGGGKRICATTNLNAGVQILMPGERARPHRHTMNALRFVIEGSGAETIVDGKPCPMEPGDMILTPAWTWHEHVHHGDERVVWLDSLDVPLVDYLDAAFFEPGPTNEFPTLAPDSAFTAAGFAPQCADDSGALAYSPLFRYSWSDAVAALAATPAAADGSRLLRYTNPATGGPVMSLLDCYLLGLPAGRETAAMRTTANAVCFVAEGDGVTRVGDQTVGWTKNDLFTLPHWNWISHRAETPDAKLFVITDRDVLRKLELLREEVED